jgi:hypothetical protein
MTFSGGCWRLRQRRTSRLEFGVDPVESLQVKPSLRVREYFTERVNHRVLCPILQSNHNFFGFPRFYALDSGGVFCIS